MYRQGSHTLVAPRATHRQTRKGSAMQSAPAGRMLLVFPGKAYELGDGQNPSAVVHPMPAQPQSHTHFGCPFRSLQDPLCPQ